MTIRQKPLSVGMPWWKELALQLYCQGTMPYRRRLQQRLSAAGQSPAMVLFYHRVADSSPNAWTCPTKTFARQMHWLQQHFDMVSLTEAERRLRSGNNTRPCVSVTFDDGYAENCDFAIPLLVREGIPCTYFVTAVTCSKTCRSRTTWLWGMQPAEYAGEVTGHGRTRDRNRQPHARIQIWEQ